LKTVTFSIAAKFPSKKVSDCFTNPDFAKLHKASKIFSKNGIYKSDKKLILRSLAIEGAAKDAPASIAVISFTEADQGKTTKIDFVITSVPDAKAADVKNLGKIISAELAKFLAPKPVAAKPVAKKPAAAKKPVAKKPAAKPVAKTAAAPATPVTVKKPW